MSIDLGDTVLWTPTGEIGTVLGLTTEPSAIVVFPDGRRTIGLSRLQRVDPVPGGRVALDQDDVDLIVQGLQCIFSGDGGSWPPADRERAEQIATRFGGPQP